MPILSLCRGWSRHIGRQIFQLNMSAQSNDLYGNIVQNTPMHLGKLVERLLLSFFIYCVMYPEKTTTVDYVLNVTTSSGVWKTKYPAEELIMISHCLHCVPLKTIDGLWYFKQTTDINDQRSGNTCSKATYSKNSCNAYQNVIYCLLFFIAFVVVVVHVVGETAWTVIERKEIYTLNCILLHHVLDVM